MERALFTKIVLNFHSKFTFKMCQFDYLFWNDFSEIINKDLEF